ncbi:ABC transporter permease [uncultured Rikenella sp.]|uniref:ABC transporter permease n=1 Tax=uncultured Rikenella sp. TaxID=368003 RepID=UPI0026055D38|nr:ABC transporter permease [uncultured Rikenella sp.]
MRKLSILLKKEFLQIFRDRYMLRVVILLPIVQLLVLPLAADYDIKNFRMAAIDRDHTQFSRRLLTKLQAGGYFSLVGSVPSWKQAEQMIEQGEADMIVEIPVDFERDMVLGRSPEVSVHISAINGLSAGVAANYVNSIAGDFATELAAEQLVPTPAEAKTVPTRIETAVQEWYNPRFDYKTVIVPGILALLITIAGLSMTALNSVKEKERGTIEQLNVTPMNRLQYMLAKMIPFFAIGLVQFTIGLVIARTVYSIPMAGNVFLLYGIVALYLVGVLCLGFVIANLSETQVQAIFPTFFIMMILILMSGLFTPVESMPEWAQRVNTVNPVAHVISSIKMVMIKGSSAGYLLWHWVWLGLFAAAMGVLSVVTFRKLRA